MALFQDLPYLERWGICPGDRNDSSEVCGLGNSNKQTEVCRLSI